VVTCVGGRNNIHIKDWLEEGKKKLEEAREALRSGGTSVDWDPRLAGVGGRPGMGNRSRATHDRLSDS
jgi:hypothetical protein